MGRFSQLFGRFVGGGRAADSSAGTTLASDRTQNDMVNQDFRAHSNSDRQPESASGMGLSSIIDDHPLSTDANDSLSYSADSYHSAVTTKDNMLEKSTLLRKDDETYPSSRNHTYDGRRDDAGIVCRRGSRRSVITNRIEDAIRPDVNECQHYDEDDACVIHLSDNPWLRRAFSDSELYYRAKLFECIDSDEDGRRVSNHQHSYSLTSLRTSGYPLLYDGDDDDDAGADGHDDALHLHLPPPLVEDADDLNEIGSEFDAAAYDCGGTSQRIIQRVWKAAWQHTPFQSLPQWLQDNNYLRRYHRPQIQSVVECFKTIFRIHSETGNIWTHMLGCLAFLSMLIFMWVATEDDLLRLTDKLILTTYFFGALLCMTFSFLFHTLYCHSDKVGRLFGKLDYCGIACMIVGSFIPWLHYSFYCHVLIKWFYISAITLLAALAITVSLWNRFGEPKYRWLRAGLFLALGLSALVPSGHYLVLEGAMKAIECAGFLWLLLMAFLYVFGAILYAVRMPERFFPGRFDIFMHSHQIFHCMVIAAAFVHYHGIMTIMVFRMTAGACEFSLPQVPLAAVS